MPRLSIIIPWADEHPAFEDTLVSVLQDRPHDCQVIVVHAHAYDDPYRLQGEIELLEVAGAGELELVNEGLRAARAPFVHVLRCGVLAQEGWVEPALARFGDSAVGAVSPVVVESRDPGHVVALGVGYRDGGRRIVRGAGKNVGDVGGDDLGVLAPTLLAGFYRRDVLLSLGGFACAVGECADIDFGLTLSGHGLQCVVETRSCMLAVQRPLRPGFQYGRACERVFWRHAESRGWKRSLMLHPWAVLVEFVRELPSWRAFAGLGGRLVTLLEHRPSPGAAARNPEQRAAMPAAKAAAAGRSNRRAA